MINDSQSQNKSAITPHVPQKPVANVKPGSKATKAKNAISDVVGRRDESVANLLHEAQEVANRETEARRKELAEKLGKQMATSELQAIEEVADFLSQTLGSSEWLLNGVSQTIDAEIVA